MEINKVARPSRSRNPPVIYTPSSIYQGKPQQMSYNLNARKALDKKMDAAERESEIEITLKAGTLVVTCNAGAYEALKHALYKYYSESQELCSKLHTKTSKANIDSSNNQIMTVEESLSIKYKNTIKFKRQLNRFNVFNKSFSLMLMDICCRTLFPKICTTFLMILMLTNPSRI
ncbi:unnamed protein product [Mytilus coruscus]|uniref:Uncharacterized protein n=1 Tax=Mytilus coruscus TaxID=42192 RepID=A0A6J8C1J7_MYTCO|nr:unnamed protein product [Mytilus coruscus]